MVIKTNFITGNETMFKTNLNWALEGDCHFFPDTLTSWLMIFFFLFSVIKYTTEPWMIISKLKRLEKVIDHISM